MWNRLRKTFQSPKRNIWLIMCKVESGRDSIFLYLSLSKDGLTKGTCICISYSIMSYPYFKHVIHYLPLGVYYIGDNDINVPMHCRDLTKNASKNL